MNLIKKNDKIDFIMNFGPILTSFELFIGRVPEKAKTIISNILGGKIASKNFKNEGSPKFFLNYRSDNFREKKLRKMLIFDHFRLILGC